MRTNAGAYYARDHGNILAHNTSKAASPSATLYDPEDAYHAQKTPLPPIARGGGDGVGRVSDDTEHDIHHPTPPFDHSPSHHQRPHAYAQPPSPSPPAGPVAVQLLRDPVQDTQLQTLYERLAENEKLQRAMVLETTRLHGEMNEAFRYQEGVLRDEVRMRRVLEDHFQFLKSVVRHLQDQTLAVSTQLSLEREAAFHNVELTKLQAAEHERFADEMRRRSEEDRAAIVSFASDLAGIRQEIGALRTDVGGRLDAVEREVQRLGGEVEELKAVGREMRNEVYGLREHVANMDARLTGSLKTADSNLVKCAAVLQDAAVAGRAVEESERARLRGELYGRVEDVMRSAQEGDEHVNQTLRHQYETLLNVIHEERRAVDEVHRDTVAHLEEKMREMNGWVRQQLAEQRDARETEASAIVRTLSDVREGLKRARVEDRLRMDALEHDIYELKKGVHLDVETLKSELETEIRKMTRPLIVM
ncbi:hypothetical protein HK104_002942 [Borealophlyctis nickersoniae]|nr:hypothetical protein HK104_002942 [Borealophlyctis nickersoniae]